MPDFALYYIPLAEHPLYPVASELIGYDLRAKKDIPVNNASRATIPGFDVSWVDDPNQYGLHMTIAHAMHFQEDRLAAIEAEIESIMNLFDPAKAWEITPCVGESYIRILPQRSCLLRYDANQAFMMLHALIVARLSPLSTGTPQLEKFMAGKLQPSLQAQHRLVQYYYYQLLDDFYPHFTLFGPALPVEDVEPVREAILSLVPQPEAMAIETLCLLVRPDGEAHYHIHREFSRKDYPQLLTVMHE
jgi:hypothetical protein